MILRFDAVAARRGGRLLFEGVSFALEPGEAALVTGPNGVGKSSLLRIAAGLLAPAAGRVTAVPPGPEGCALMAEQAALDPERPLRAALGFWVTLDRHARDQVAARVEAALAAVELGGLGEVPVRLLSTGQRRRASLARVVASGASLWLLDEPGNGLDAASLARLEALMAAHRAGGGAVVVATHQPLALPAAQMVALAGVSADRESEAA